jgi:hypothetical protein
MSPEAIVVEAVAHFWAGPDREHDAALAWAYDLTHYFKRGVGEPPMVIATESAPQWQAHNSYYGDGYYDTACGLYLNFWGSYSPPQPLVIYECRGLMTTTHPGDHPPVATFDKGAAWSLDYSLDEGRQASLRKTYAASGPRWDGR